MQLMKKGKHGNGGKIEEVRESTGELKVTPKERFILQTECSGLPESIIKVMKAKSSNWLRG